MKKLKKAQRGKYTGTGPYNEFEEGAEIYQDIKAQSAVNIVGATNGQVNQPSQFQTQRTFGEDWNWKHILGSHMAGSMLQGISNYLPNSQQNAVLRFNQQQYTPTSYLPYTSNNSVQDQFGIKEFQDGGEVGEEDMMKFLFADDSRTQDAPIEYKKRQEAPTMVDNGPSDEEVFAQLDFRRSIPMGKQSQRLIEDGPSKGLDPNVVAATKELQAKFPGLRITSTIRNWGDKDAHPKGRAIDVAGKDTDEAWKYYSDVIVPKYGFNKALDPNHGTGKHIHVGYYKKGGINDTGYLDGAETANNDYNIIPGGNITMQGVSKPVMAIPIKGNKMLSPTIMLPGTDHQFDADMVLETMFKKGGTYKLGDSRHGKMSKEMARKILFEGKVNGKPITKRQEAYFEHIANGDIKFKDNKPVLKYEQGGVYELSDKEIQDLLAQGYELDIK